MESILTNSNLGHWYRVQGSSQNNYFGTTHIKTDTPKKFISNIIPLPQLTINDRQCTEAKNIAEEMRKLSKTMCRIIFCSN